MSITVRTQSELESAIKQGVKSIIIQGALAEEFKAKIKKQKRRKRAAAGGALAAGAIAVGSILAAPATGGISLFGLLPATGTAAAAAGTAAVTITGTEIIAGLGLILGGSLAAYAISKGYKKVSFRPDGTVILERD
jgi:hypothetical protein